MEMNTQTRINVNDVAPEIAAVRLLNGEAEFDADRLTVEKVVVQASSGAVYARHARFQIRYTDRDVCVTCTRGSVEVRLGALGTAIYAGQQLTFNDNMLGTPALADTSSVTAWKRRMLIFSQASLAEVVQEVNRYRSGKLILRGERLAKQKVQASFSLDRLEDVVALIRDVYGARTTSLPGGIVIFQQA
ncbi:hypothetical protein GCM10007205_01060 [Oxalicibacterium flavum]|uniref:FecR protein domain-containing protein n=1 Tax=Oxalicibacterium flavum TaxID=179467 RepID=A0A8J2XX03_9BURK|nr:hypothetical protein GCM10007205_01060 [Oxalicibacterium flavum]